MPEYESVLIVQTAFIGDVILTLPLIQVLHREMPEARIDVVAIPVAAAALENHPAIHRVIVYDKRGTDAGIGGVLRLGSEVKKERYAAALVPHRSIRSAVITWLGGMRVRVGFSTSAGRALWTKTVEYRRDRHEIDRNLSLLAGLGISSVERVLPDVYPSADDRRRVDTLLRDLERADGGGESHLIAVAPGSVWNTKRWPEENFVKLVRLLRDAGRTIALVGGPADGPLCTRVRERAGEKRVINAAGSLTLLQSAELIRRARVLVSNDSAPMHLGVAVRTPVVAIFGATVPEFGFAPAGEFDQVLETPGLSCRPCSIHGGDTCPVKTFDCMVRITPSMVGDAIQVAEKRSSKSRW